MGLQDSSILKSTVVLKTSEIKEFHIFTADGSKLISSKFVANKHKDSKIIDYKASRIKFV